MPGVSRYDIKQHENLTESFDVVFDRFLGKIRSGPTRAVSEENCQTHQSGTGYINADDVPCFTCYPV